METQNDRRIAFFKEYAPEMDIEFEREESDEENEMPQYTEEIVQKYIMDGKYRCPMCHIELMRFSSFKSHLEQHWQPSVTFDCSYCNL